MNIQRIYGHSFIILQRTDTQEYLSKFEFFTPDPPQWSSEPTDSLRFITHSDAESNFRLILDRMGDPLDRALRIRKCEVAVKGDEFIMSEPTALSVSIVA